MESMVGVCSSCLCPLIPRVRLIRLNLTLSILILDPKDLPLPTLYAFICGLVAMASLLTFSSPDKPPKWHKCLCAIGFVVAIAWISTIADEVVGILRAMGSIVGVSEAILGVTVFAMVSTILYGN